MTTTEMFGWAYLIIGLGIAAYTWHDAEHKISCPNHNRDLPLPVQMIDKRIVLVMLGCLCMVLVLVWPLAVANQLYANLKNRINK